MKKVFLAIRFDRTTAMQKSSVINCKSNHNQLKIFSNLKEILLMSMRTKFVPYQKTILVLSAIIVIANGFMSCGHEFSPAIADKVDFNYDIRPILVQKCYLCHGPDPGSRKGNLRLDTYEGATAVLKDGLKAINPEHGEKSLVLVRINHKDPDIMMPTPESNLKLTEREIALIEKWIDQGAEWKPHWALIPAKESQAVKEFKGNPIDYFINQKLAENDLKSSAEADKNSLIRRVSYVLTGLPPDPTSINKFIADNSANAYEKMVDQYLQAPQFGERWARHWMDLVRYAETKGHEFDYTISGAWRYRDYLIRAFNNDVPYDQLIQEQLAGDLLQKPRINESEKINESQIGTMFYTMAEGTHSPVDVRKDEADRIDNMIDVTGKAFQALTISCARCHDHKFDPISTKDYYSFYGVMEGTRFAPIPANVLEASNKVRALQLLNDTIRQEIVTTWMKNYSATASTKITLASSNKIENPTDGILLGDFSKADFDGWKSDGLAFTNGTTLGDPVFNTQHKVVGLQEGRASSRRLSTGIFGALRSPDFIINNNFIGVKAAGKKASIRVVIDNFQLISWPIYGGMDQRVDTSKFMNIVFDVTQWKGHKAYIELLPGMYETHVFKMSNDAYIEAKYAIGFDKDWFEPAVELQPTAVDATQALYAVAEQKASFNDLKLINTLLRSKRLNSQVNNMQSLLERKAVLQQSFTDSIEFLNGVSDGFGTNSPVFIRGNHKELSKDPVERSFISAIKVANPNFNVKGSGRLQLAVSITDPNNTLTSRVMVNRIWHHLFGRGIVETVDNFGMQGKLPSHPELLDHLAIQFQKDRYSIKKTIRSILLSNAFKRSVVPVEKSAKEDPSNIWLSHYPIRRLEAEAIRDAMLAASGKLDKTLYGVPVAAHIDSFMNGRGKPAVSGPLDGNGRRSLYLEVRRNFLNPMLTTFDRPMPFSAFGKRTVTNVPSQSLILLNDPFVIQEAEFMAKQLLAKKITALDARIRWVYQRSLGRNPQPDEIADADLLMNQLKKTYASKGVKENIELIIWKDYIHSVFNLKEFIYLN